MALIFKTAVSVISLAMMGVLVAVGIKSDETGKLVSNTLILIYGLCILAMWV